MANPSPDKGNAELLRIGGQMANVMFNLAQRPGDALTGDHVATMDSLRKQWDSAVRAIPPSPSTGPRKFHVKDHVVREVVNSLRDTALEFHAHQSLRERLAAALAPLLSAPSTAPEVPPFPESLGLADVPHAMNTPDDWDADYRATWQKLQVAETNLSQMRAYARKLRNTLASRPAEVDDEGLPPLPEPFENWDPRYQGLVLPIFTAEQFRQGQRDAVAADRARREKGGA